MKDEQRVFIRGVEGRGSEVIKTLEDRGGISAGEHGDCPWNIYFITHSGSVDYCPEDDETAKIIMDNYRELHLPEQWKDGDVLIKRDEELYAVFSHEIPYSSFIASLQVIDGCIENYTNGVICNRVYYRLATPSEVERFHDILHRHGKEWDAEKKELIDWRWKPKVGDYYYYVSAEGDIIRYRWVGYPVDERGFEFGNCFRTREEAEAMAEKIKKLLKGETN